MPNLELVVVASLLVTGASTSPRQIWRAERRGKAVGVVELDDATSLLTLCTTTSPPAPPPPLSRTSGRLRKDLERWEAESGGSGGGRETERRGSGSGEEGEGVEVGEAESRRARWPDVEAARRNGWLRRQ